MAWYLLVRHNSARHHTALAEVSSTINKTNKTFHLDDPDRALGCLHVYRCIHTHTPQLITLSLSRQCRGGAVDKISTPQCQLFSLVYGHHCVIITIFQSFSVCDNRRNHRFIVYYSWHESEGTN